MKMFCSLFLRIGIGEVGERTRVGRRIDARGVEHGRGVGVKVKKLANVKVYGYESGVGFSAKKWENVRESRRERENLRMNERMKIETDD